VGDLVLVVRSRLLTGGLFPPVVLFQGSAEELSQDQASLRKALCGRAEDKPCVSELYNARRKS